ncbi:MAG: alpha/beta fold hydrolase [Chloroflexi bacterium]|nr:alpha/beta fold hydrolase [Chloroflexota bacterium]
MIKLLVSMGAILMLGALGFLLLRNKPEPRTYTVPEGARPGDLTALEPCDYKPNKKNTFRAECGTLTVPENWDDPASRRIALPVYRIPATHPGPAEPVFVLLGGPGASNLLFTPREWLFENRDVVLVGYRGVDGSVDLVCPQVSQASARQFGKNFLSEAATAELAQAVGQCAADFQAAGVDLRGYTVQGVVADMEAARQALGYERVNLWSESYGTRVAQLYAYLHPESLNRVLMIGVNTPGHFVYDPAALDGMLQHISKLCAQDPECSRRTGDLAQAIGDLNHDMPKRWLIFPIDPGTIRTLTQMMFFSTSTMPLVVDAYLSAANGDPSGLALLNLMGPFMFSFDTFHMGDFLNKGGTLDLEYYHGPESVQLGSSRMGAPLAEWVWPMAVAWPLELVEADLRHLQESNVDMLAVNGTLDFSTPPVALDELQPYYNHAQTVLLPEFSHVDDVENLQPQAIERLVTRYYDTGVADASLFTYQPLSFKPGMSPARMAKALVAGMVLFPPLLIAVVVILWRRKRARGRAEKGIQ